VFSTTATGGSAINDGLYHHVVGVRNKTAGYMALYVDGVLINSLTDTSSTIPLGNPVWIGGYGSNSFITTWGFTGGTLDEVAIYYLALTPEQVKRHYRIGAGVD
jgi:hypothetical protein